MRELLSRARGAAGLALRGWDTEDRADCAAELVARVLERVPAGGNTESVPEAWVAGGVLFGMAANWRRSAERQRASEAQLALSAAAEGEGFSAFVPAEVPELDGTPEGAERRAQSMLEDIGVPAEGAFWTLAYSAARSVDGTDDGKLGGRELAAELELTTATLRQHQSRAAKRTLKLRPGTTGDYGEALGVSDHRPHRSGKVERDARMRPSYPAPVEVKRTRKLAPWSGRKRSAWGAEVTPASAARLSTAARNQRAQANGRTDAERQALRLAAGIPS